MSAEEHLLLSGGRVWPESNCYVDLWISALHALRLDPVPMLLCTISPQFEVDQWTFCKPTAGEIAVLYGIRVEELNIWRAVREQVESQVQAGRLVLLEVDAYHLPDTAGVSYETAHQKTTIGIRAFDSVNGGMEYFHNKGRFILDRYHTERVFASGVTSAMLPPFAEFADLRGMETLNEGALATRARALASVRLRLAGRGNPFTDWAARASAQLTDLASRDLANFHAWAFATVRQAGSMAELAGQWCVWMRRHAPGAEPATWQIASDALQALAQTLAAQQFRLARVPQGGAHDGFGSALSRCAVQWFIAADALRALMADRAYSPNV